MAEIVEYKQELLLPAYEEFERSKLVTDSSLRRSGVGSVFIKNLDKTIDNKTMYDTFSEFGNILSCKIEQDENGVSKGFGFIHFETEEAANTTIDKVNGMLLRAKHVYVGKFIPREVREKDSGGNVYVKNFGEDWNDIKLKETFEQFGKITSHRVFTADNGKPKGFGFVAFETNEAAKAAINALNGTKLPDGKLLYVGHAQMKAERQQELKRKFKELQNSFRGRNLFVKYLDETIDEQLLRTLFLKFGRLTSVKIMMDEQGRSKGFGFVCFESAANASSAIAEMNRQIVGSKPLYVAYAQPKEERTAFLTDRYMRTLSDMQQIRQNSQPGGANGFLLPTMPQPQQFFDPRATYIGPVSRLIPQTQVCTASAAATASNAQCRSRAITGTPQSAQLRTVRKKVQFKQTVRTIQQKGQEPLNASSSEQRQIIGEKLFTIINRVYPDLAGKITGMLLEYYSDNSELVLMLENTPLLTTEIIEAAALLRNDQAGQESVTKTE